MSWFNTIATFSHATVGTVYGYDTSLNTQLPAFVFTGAERPFPESGYHQLEKLNNIRSGSATSIDDSRGPYFAFVVGADRPAAGNHSFSIHSADGTALATGTMTLGSTEEDTRFYALTYRGRNVTAFTIDMLQSPGGSNLRSDEGASFTLFPDPIQVTSWTSWSRILEFANTSQLVLDPSGGTASRSLNLEVPYDARITPGLAVEVDDAVYTVVNVQETLGRRRMRLDLS